MVAFEQQATLTDEEVEMEMEFAPVQVPALPGRAFHKYEVLYSFQLNFVGRA